MSTYGNLSEKELLDLILTKYEGMTMLSKDYQGACFYAPIVNGIGCAIGCLLPLKVADKWDRIGSIDDVQHMESEQYAQWFADEQCEVLVHIQDSHDTAKNVEEFLAALHVLRDKYVKLEQLGQGEALWLNSQGK